MRIRLIQSLAALAAVGLLAGCADGLYERRLIPPQGDGAQTCLDRCTRLKDECEGRQRERERGCAEHAAGAKADYERCLGAKAAPCTPPESCPAPEMGICERQHQECFSGCGGAVERQFRPRLWGTAPQAAPTPTTAPPPA